MSLPSGATISADEMKRIQDALDALTPGTKTYNAHNPRQISVTVNLHVHVEYPKVMYKGTGDKRKHVKVEDVEAEQQAAAQGFGAFQPDPAETEE